MQRLETSTNNQTTNVRTVEFPEWFEFILIHFCNKKMLYNLCSLNSNLRRQYLPHFAKGLVLSFKTSPPNLRQDFLNEISKLSVNLEWWQHVEEKQRVLLSFLPKLDSVSLVDENENTVLANRHVYFPTRLTSLKLYAYVGGPLTKSELLIFPKSLQTLSLPFGFCSKSTHFFEQFTQLTQLHMNFVDQECCDLIIPSSVIVFNGKLLSKIRLPPNLHTLKLQNIDLLEWNTLPSSLQKLKIRFLQQSLPENLATLLPNLLKLSLLDGCVVLSRLTLKPGQLPPGLMELRIDYYDLPLEVGVLPNTLQTVHLMAFDYDMCPNPASVFPKGLKNLCTWHAGKSEPYCVHTEQKKQCIF